MLSDKIGKSSVTHSELMDDEDNKGVITMEMLEEYKEAFELFDKDGDGTISTGELKNLLKCFDLDLPDEEVQELIKKYDENNQGSLGFDQLKEVMRNVERSSEVDPEIH